ncbi:DUF1971 domain-containing protein [Ancylobacter amanitiformis]|uniref:Truncated hemoglobin YjbI/tellurite resistance-related uncharacterized protein n=1 Tax=Ancylobacter amanitiformis TaxID=217069 RepID=A0ABU0LV54_9HYPH|nr:DUF1971 domain-containing protein [Ancylobacter amanitiformis]MDQ0512488.1 truncated hemoglobin YjbI/tellurite resistance-related uncharacterized protein [Ancylobacter amanitiformis]
MPSSELDDAGIARLLALFYQRVRQDRHLGPVFEGIVADWGEHLVRLEEFWSSVMLTSARYKGNPVAMHVLHSAEIRPFMFERWLDIWRQTTDDMLDPAIARPMQVKAARIAERLSLAMHGPKAIPAPIYRPEADERLEPYRVSPAFDETTIPPALLRDHATKAGVWGIIRVLDGTIRYWPDDARQPLTLDSATPGLIRPGQPHHLSLTGSVRLQVEFYDRDPVGLSS